jgi:hypothetical protein
VFTRESGSCTTTPSAGRFAGQVNTVVTFWTAFRPARGHSAAVRAGGRLSSRGGGTGRREKPGFPPAIHAATLVAGTRRLFGEAAMFSAAAGPDRFPMAQPSRARQDNARPQRMHWLCGLLDDVPTR